jgi:hypothetical protein
MFRTISGYVVWYTVSRHMSPVALRGQHQLIRFIFFTRNNTVTMMISDSCKGQKC